MKPIIYLLLYIGCSFCVAQPLAVKETAPAFSLPLLNNEHTITLSDYKGKVVYVDFWASWCVPCRRSFPFLNALRKEYADKGFEVIAINLEQESEAANAFLAQHPVSYPVVAGYNSTVGTDYEIIAMPTAYIIGKNGNIRVKHMGFNPAQKDYLEAVVDKLVSEF
ncbi:MAG: TlpA family protein disulfide reductase [Pseudoalteromonas sp.]|uniref:TlpA family protein disulfide reductase n=1 Tax=unclassified Pseudoalteromonas TaxID=194690 RepID=UPI003F945799